jgi:O-antigen/teichoic acid export membrane protein
LNVLVARRLAESQYGEFALFLGTIFVARAVDYSLISFPLSVRLAQADKADKPRMLTNSLVLAAILSLGLVIVLGAGTLMLKNEGLLLPVCMCYLAWQAQETLRRCLLADFRYRDAILGDLVGFMGPVLLLGTIVSAESTSLETTLYLMSAALIAGAAVHLSKLRLVAPAAAELWALARGYVSLGKWSLVSYQLALLRTQFLPWYLAVVSGVAATGVFQAGLNIANMINPISFGIGNIIPQAAAYAYGAGGVLGAARAASRYVLFGLGPVLVLCGAALVMPTLLLELAYGASSPYLSAALALQLLAVAGLLDYVAEMLSKTLLGVEAGRLAFLVNAIGVASAVLISLLLIDRFGYIGGCAAMLAANCMRVLAGSAAVAWLIGREKRPSPGTAAQTMLPIPADVPGSGVHRVSQ